MERHQYGNLTNSERQKILQFLLQNVKDPEADPNKLKRGALKAATEKFKCNRKTVYTLWNQAIVSSDNGNSPMNVDSRKLGNCGRKPKDRTASLELMRRVPMRRRQTIRSYFSP